MKIILVRHGESEYNIKIKEGAFLYCGQYNTPLSEKGKQDSLKLKNNKYINQIEKAYSSDLDRAFQTATLALGHTNIIKDKNLRERSLGVFEGNYEWEMMAKYPDFFNDSKNSNFRKDFVARAPGGENYTDVCNRVTKFLKNFDCTQDITIGVFSHVHLIRCFIYVLTNISIEQFYKVFVKNNMPILLEGKKIGEFKIVSHKLEELYDC